MPVFVLLLNITTSLVFVFFTLNRVLFHPYRRCQWGLQWYRLLLFISVGLRCRWLVCFFNKLGHYVLYVGLKKSLDMTLMISALRIRVKVRAFGFSYLDKTIIR